MGHGYRKLVRLAREAAFVRARSRRRKMRVLIGAGFGAFIAAVGMCIVWALRDL